MCQIDISQKNVCLTFSVQFTARVTNCAQIKLQTSFCSKSFLYLMKRVEVSHRPIEQIDYLGNVFYVYLQIMEQTSSRLAEIDFSNDFADVVYMQSTGV